MSGQRCGRGEVGVGSDSDSGQRHPDTIAFIVATRRGDSDSDSHSATESGTHTDCDCDCDWGLASTQCTAFVRSPHSFVRSFVGVFIAFVSFVRLFDSLSRARLGHPLSITQRCLRVLAIVTPPLAPWESHTLSLPTLSGLRSARLGVRLFVCSAALSRCPQLASLLCSASFISIFRVYR